MRRIAVIAPLNEDSGYGVASRLYVKALLTTGAEIACRNIYLSKKKELPAFLQEAAKRPLRPDAILQIIPPYAQEPAGPHSVGLFFTETTPLPGSWARRASLMDGQISPCRAQVAWCEASGRWDVPTHVVPVPCELERYERDYPVPRQLNQVPRDQFLFYTVGENATRKNIKGTLTAFMSGFRHYEAVGLVIKTGGPPEPVYELINRTATSLKLKRIPPVYVVTERLTDDEMLGLHQRCDVFVQPSCGESWSLPAFDAMAMGKTPIVSAAGGYLDYLDDSTGWLVPTHQEPCHDEGEVHAVLFSGKRSWFSPDMGRLTAQMTEAFGDSALRARKGSAGKLRARDFSLERVGHLLVGALYENCQALDRV